MYKCKECDETFEHPWQLGQHVQRAHKKGEIKPAGSEEVEGFLDNEARFLSLLKSYGIKSPSPETVVSYCSSQGEGIYGNLERLRRCLVEQGVPSGKVGPILKHWAAIEQLPLPEKLAAEMEIPNQPPAPKLQDIDRWSIVAGAPVRDPSGQFTWIQALQYLEVQAKAQAAQSPPPQRDETVNMLLQQNQEILKRMDDNRWGTVADTFSSMRQEIKDIRDDRRETNRFSVVNDLGKELFTELRGGRADLRTLAQVAIERGQRPMTPEEKTRLATAGKRAVADQRRVEILAHEILSSDISPRPRPAVPPPPVIIQQQ